MRSFQCRVGPSCGTHLPCLSYSVTYQWRQLWRLSSRLATAKANKRLFINLCSFIGMFGIELVGWIGGKFGVVALELLGNGSVIGLALKSLWKFNRPNEVMVKSLWELNWPAESSSELTLELLWNCPGIAVELELLWESNRPAETTMNCSEIGTTLRKSQLKFFWTGTGTALKSLLNCTGTTME